MRAAAAGARARGGGGPRRGGPSPRRRPARGGRGRRDPDRVGRPSRRRCRRRDGTPGVDGKPGKGKRPAAARRGPTPPTRSRLPRRASRRSPAASSRSRSTSGSSRSTPTAPSAASPRSREEIRSLDPDIVLLQEVDRFHGRTGGIDQVAYFADALGMQGTFSPNVVQGSGQYGTAILSRFDDPRLGPLPAAQRRRRRAPGPAVGRPGDRWPGGAGLQHPPPEQAGRAAGGPRPATSPASWPARTSRPSSAAT